MALSQWRLAAHTVQYCIVPIRKFETLLNAGDVCSPELYSWPEEHSIHDLSSILRLIYCTIEVQYTVRYGSHADRTSSIETKLGTSL